MHLVKPVVSALQALLGSLFWRKFKQQRSTFGPRGRLRQLCPACWRRWDGLPLFVRHLTVNLLLGLIITLALLPVPDNPFSKSVDDSAVDWMIARYLGSTPVKETPPFVLLDIDEHSYREWGEPAVTPRDHLLTLLRLAVEAKPKLVLVDIDLAHRLKPQALHPHDQALYDFIQGYDKTYCAKQACPQILLLRSFQQPLDEHNQVERKAYPMQRTSFLDPAVAASTHIQWASTRFELDRDRVLRRWRLWEATCDNGQAGAVPSMQLLGTALLDAAPQTAVQRVRDALNAPQNCKQEAGKLKTDATLALPNLDTVVDLSPSRLNTRILYRIPAQTKAGERRPTHNVAGGRPLYQSYSAHTVLQQKRVDEYALQDSITVIGQSFYDSRDLYITPVGRMPGALIIVNALHSLHQHGQLKPPPLWQRLLAEAGAILLLSLAFAWFRSFYGMLFSGVLVIAVLLPLSFRLFEYGIWLDSAIPLIVIQLHRMAQRFEKEK